jgi:hypothetical protein
MSNVRPHRVQPSSSNRFFRHASKVARIRKLASRLRFSLYTLTLAVVASAGGIALVYVAVLAWRKGAFSSRRFGVVYQSADPGMFYLLLGMGVAVGLALLVATPFIAAKLFAPPEEQARVAAAWPRVYAPVRPSLWLALGGLLALIGYALLLA